MKKIEKSAPRAEASNGAERARQEKMELLRQEVRESVRQVLAAEKSEETKEDIAPLIDAVGRYAEESGFMPPRSEKEKALADFDKKRFSWGLVGESLRGQGFAALSERIKQPVANGNYKKAEEIINTGIYDIIEKLMPTIRKNPDELRAATLELKNKFYENHPEVKSLIYGAAEGKKAKIKIPKGETSEESGLRELGERRPRSDEERVAKEGIEEEAEKPKYEHPRFLREKTWDVPKDDQLKPGLIVELENVETSEKETVELLSEPHLYKGEDVAVHTRTTARGSSVVTLGTRYLADMGLTPYPDGNWEGWRRPIRWEMKKEKSENQ